MTQYYLTDEQFENVMQPLIVSMLGWDDPLVAKQKDVRITWPEEGQPAWKITENVVFLRCFEIDAPYNKERENEDTYSVSPDEFSRETSYTRIMQVDIIIYGPSSFANAQTIRDGVFKQDYKDVLADNKIYFIPDAPSPRRVPEYWEGRWWKRYDISFRFNMLTVKESVVPAVTSVEVGIYEGDEGNKIAEVNVGD